MHTEWCMFRVVDGPIHKNILIRHLRQKMRNHRMSEQTDYKNIKLFPGLNSLRFMAAFLVLMHHSETIKSKHGIVNFDWLGLFKNGGNAVTFFFVLSGFLITYLLLKERHKTATTSIKNFYLKRVLRIWPLYFLLVFIGTVALPVAFGFVQVDYEMPYTLGQTWYWFVFFLPGMVTFLYGSHFLEPLWSIGVEEVFYLMWAPLFKISKQHILWLLIGVIVLKTVLSIVGHFYITNELFHYLMSIFKFEAMAVGGLGAWLVFTKGEAFVKSVAFKIPVQIAVFAVLVTFLTFHINIDNVVWQAVFSTPVVSSLLVDVLFLYLILCVSVVDHSIVKFRSKALSFLGEISYGIYMYHLLAIFITIHFLKPFLQQSNAATAHLLFYVLVSALTFIIASLSKYLFEDYFLRLKSKVG